MIGKLLNSSWDSNNKKEKSLSKKNGLKKITQSNNSLAMSIKKVEKFKRMKLLQKNFS